ncbi:MAG TPA: methyltransferase domain-containing protein [Polyangiaceae bacterium]
MTIENSEDAAHVGVTDPADQPGPERASALAGSPSDPDIPIDVDPPVLRADLLEPAVIEPPTSDAVSDSMPPMSRKLAPPPKPRRDSGAASRPPLAGPSGEEQLLASALKAPIAPSISYSAPAAATPPVVDAAETVIEVPTTTPGSVPPLGAPPPIPRRKSNPAIADASESATRSPSDPALAAAGTSAQPKPVSAAPRPISGTPPLRTHSEPPPPAPAPAASAEPVERAPESSPPPSSSAIFAMRIIAVGDPSRAAPVQAEQSGETDPNAYPPSAARLGTGTRRSSRPTMAAVTAPDVVTAKPPDVDLSPLVAEPAAVALEAAPVAPPSAVAPVAAEVTEELADEDVAPDSVEKKIQAAAEAEELGREDAISVLPEELPTFQAEAKTDPGKPPPPPKRTGGATTSAPASEPAAPPPTPDLAAAKAAQRKNTRQPWWEDLFNEDFMRATARVSDEQIRREVTFIEDSLGVAAGGVVLDLGCGAGHHAVEFASRGYGVVGYDLSLYQLALAADVAQERSQKINFLQGDMREMAFEEMFDGVFCWNTSFGYFEEDKNLAVAQRVFKALRPGGMFLIDVINRDFAAASAPCTVWYEGDSCVCMDDMSVDFISSRLRVKRSIILDDGRTKESLFSLRLYSLHELGKLLHEVGFRVTEASGHPATPGVFFGPNSPRIIMLAQRP